MNKNRERKERLYSTFAANLALYWTDSAGQFICPLCMRVFDRAALGQLDLAHIVPDALGGSKVTLTCKPCNNRIGREIECHEVEAARAEMAFKDTDSKLIRGRIRFRLDGQESGSVGITMRGGMGETMPELNLKAVEKVSNPAEMQRITRMFEQAARNGGDWAIEIQWHNGVDPHRAQLTYLHIAYLYMFHQFGYEWVFDPTAALVREQLQRPDEELVTVKLLSVTPHQERPQTWGVHVIYQPEDALGFLVAFPPLKHLGSWGAVWMPLFEGAYAPPMEMKGRKEVTALADLHSGLADPAAAFRGRNAVLTVLHRQAPALIARLVEEQRATGQQQAPDETEQVPD